MNNLKKFRKTRGFTQLQLSKILDIPLKSYQKYESDERDINKCNASLMYKICLALNCDMKDIVDSDKLKQEYLDSIAKFLAELEMNSSTHDDSKEDHDTLEDFYISNVKLDRYTHYVMENWNLDRKDADQVQKLVLGIIKKTVDS